MNKKIICVECGDKDNVELKETMRLYSGEEYRFELLVKIPFCKTCGAPVYDEELEMEIAQRVNKIIREQKNIITKEEILLLLEEYKVSQKFLSRLLGWGEITLTRYISGNYTPNKNNSDKLKSLHNPYVFMALLNDYAQNSERFIEDKKLFEKAKRSVEEQLRVLEERGGKIFRVVNWFLSCASEEIPMTHLALQKLLYFAQSWSGVLTGHRLFEDECQAWAHGAVYPGVYEIFREFKYSPLPKVELGEVFDKNESKILNSVKKYYFEIYNAKTLECICHSEDPYRATRGELWNSEKCKDIIKKEDIMLYYRKIVEKYGISLEHISNIKQYLTDILNYEG